MILQPTLFDHPIALCEPKPDLDMCFNRHGGNAQSDAAHQRVQKSRDRALVYGFIKAAGTFGHTVDEISLLLDRAPNRISGRITELKKAGEIVASFVTRPTRTGSPARVYIAT